MSFRLMLFGVAVFCMGCSSGNTPEQLMGKLNKSDIQRLSNLYVMFQAMHDWTGPSTMEEFKEFVEGVSAKRLKMMGVDPNDRSSLFVGRDGQEYEIRLEVKGSPNRSVAPVIFEKEGVNGKRMVGFTSAEPREASSDQEFDDWLAGQFVDPDAGGRGGRRPPVN